jgi:hypothetical protein
MGPGTWTNPGWGTEVGRRWSAGRSRCPPGESPSGAAVILGPTTGVSVAGFPDVPPSRIPGLALKF